jgi:hypothetical protein
MRNRPLSSEDAAAVEAAESSNANDLAVDGIQAERDEGDKGEAVGANIRIDLVPNVMEGGLDAQGGGVEASATVQSEDVDSQAGPQRRRNPRRGKQSDTINM